MYIDMNVDVPLENEKVQQDIKTDLLSFNATFVCTKTPEFLRIRTSFEDEFEAEEFADRWFESAYVRAITYDDGIENEHELM
jgi:hypothetical protein